MATVQGATSGSSNIAAASVAGATTATTSSDIQDRFLKLLVTQLKNQDPLNPMDNAQLTSQLSQISTVTGIEKLNASIQAMSASLMSAQALQSAGLIGHYVFTEGNQLNFDGNAAALGGVNLTQAVDSLKVNVIGPSGNVVRQLDLGAAKAGLAGFQWDGLSDNGSKAAAGAYTFQVKAASGGHAVPATALMTGLVSSVSLGSDGAHAIVDGVGDLRMDQIKRIM
jgi:flagellar basal-body rod modification protein FlgD